MSGLTEQQRIDAIKANGGRHLQNFKKENITYNMCLAAVENDGEALYFVPEQFRAQEIYEVTVKTTGSMLSRVPEEFITEAMCKNAVTSDGLALEFVPDKFKTNEIYLIAASQNPLAFQRMPEELITVEFVVSVINKYKRGTEAVASLPKALKNAKFYIPLVEECTDVIWKLPKNAHTVAIAKACIKGMKCNTLAEAVQKDPIFISQVPPTLYDYDTCKAFVNSDFFIHAIKKEDAGDSSNMSNYDYVRGLFYLFSVFDEEHTIPYMTKWPDICLELVSAKAYYISYIKPEMLTQEMYEIAKRESKTISIGSQEG